MYEPENVETVFEHETTKPEQFRNHFRAKNP